MLNLYSGRLFENQLLLLPGVVITGTDEDLGKFTYLLVLLRII